VHFLEDYLDRITNAVKENLKFPERTAAHGFNVSLNSESIREINYDESMDPEGVEVGAISAIDGGSTPILKTPSQELVLNRVYCNKFDRMGKLEFAERWMFISRTKVVAEGSKVFFETDVFSEENACPFGTLRVDSEDDNFKIGRTRGDLERAKSMARRFCEWNFVSEALKSGADFIVMDGSLQTAFTSESELANTVYGEASARGVVVAGLSKSSTIYTEEGYPLAGFLDQLARRRGLTKWMVDVGRSEEWAHRAKVFFVRLHEGADRAFRLDVHDEAQESSVVRLINSLQSNSKYFAFPGYPYALIDAHTYAKVSQEEAMHIRDLILDRLSLEDATRLEQVERALTGHDVLDELR
jgi:hypothetical protein